MTLSQLRRIVVRGAGVSVVLCGEAGLGKSYRARRVLSDLSARQFSFSAQWPLARLVGSLPAAPQEPQWATALLERLSRGERLPPADAAQAVYQRLSTHAPALLLIDHLHRASPDALAFWEALGKQVRGGRGVGLLALTRGEPLPDWTVERVEPLTREESDAVLREKRPDLFSPLLAERIYGQARGHPLFTLELLEHLTATGVPSSAEEWPALSGPLPMSLQAFVRSQLPPSLSPPLQLALARVLLRADMDGHLVDGQSTGPQLQAEAAELVRCGVLRQGQLAHPLYREALLPLLSPDVGAAALDEVLQDEGLGDAALVARFARSWPLPPQVQLSLYRRAAEQMEERGELTRAAGFWEQAAELCPAERAAWLYRASRLYEFYPFQPGLHLRSLRAMRGAVEAAGEGVPEAWLRRLVTWQAIGRRPLEDLAALLPGELDDWRLTYLYGQLSGADIADGGIWEAWQALSDEQRATAPAEVLAGVAHAERTPPDEVARLWPQAIARAPDALSRLQWRGIAAYEPYFRMQNAISLREFDAVVEELEMLQAEIRAQEKPISLDDRLAADRAEQLIQTFNRARAVLRSRLGDVAGAAALRPSVLKYARERQALTFYVGTLYREGWEDVNRGRFEEAQRLLTEAHSTGRIRGGVVMALIDLYVHWNREEQAHLLVHAVTELREQMQTQTQLQEYFMLALGLSACGDWAEAMSLLEEGERQAREADVGHALDYGLWIRAFWHGEQGQQTQAARLATEAATSARSRGLEREANRYALWATFYAGDEVAYAAAAARVREQGDLGHLHAVESRRSVSLPVSRAHLQILGVPRLLDAGGQPLRSPAGLRLLTALLHARLLGETDVSANDLAGQLYPEVATEQARRNVLRLIRQLWATLGPEVVLQSGDGYALGAVSSDAELFLNEGASDLWRGPLPLSAEPRGEAVAARLLARLRDCVLALLTENPAQAARLAGYLSESEPYDLAALRLLLHAHDLAGQSAQARAAYARARDTFAEVDEPLPADWREFLGGSDAVPVLQRTSVPSARAASRARALHVHRSTIARWDNGQTRPGRVGRPPRLTPEQLAELRRVMAKPPAEIGLPGNRWNLALAAEYVARQFGHQLSQAQLSRLLRR
ncbi:MAG: hypothetical protein Q4C89_08175 [Deinococcus sp.]|uniref:AAA family ATPase n=1 Tax=Deinococcus sp. TaxID=47478 RepID=UPI0026DDC77B|nr:AAA family ATPase [Deinococcus sp.]MDO4245983.1 hypothetical protein [Deinococcus sp.]